jgi:hypothetical protein
MPAFHHYAERKRSAMRRPGIPIDNETGPAHLLEQKLNDVSAFIISFC